MRGVTCGCWKRLARVPVAVPRQSRVRPAGETCQGAGGRWAAVGVQAGQIWHLAAVRRQIRTGFSKSLPCGDPLPACDDDAIWGNHGPVAGDAQSPMIVDALRSVSRFRPQTVIAALIWRQCRGPAYPGTSRSNTYHREAVGGIGGLRGS
jgi:hypothetical protein